MATHPKTSRKKAQILSFSFFILGIAYLAITQNWWPAIMLVFGFPIAFREYLLGRNYDAFVTIVVFLGIFLSVQFDYGWAVVLPVLFTVAGIYIFFRDFFHMVPETEVEEEEEVEKEIEEKDQK